MASRMEILGNVEVVDKVIGLVTDIKDKQQKQIEQQEDKSEEAEAEAEAEHAKGGSKRKRRGSIIMKVKERIPWNRGKTGVQVAWNRGKTGIYSEETKKKIGVAAFRNKGRKLKPKHRKHIAEAMNKIKQCSNCSIKSQWIYQVSIPSITHYHLLLCDTCLLSYYRSGEKLEVVAKWSSAT